MINQKRRDEINDYADDKAYAMARKLSKWDDMLNDAWTHKDIETIDIIETKVEAFIESIEQDNDAFWEEGVRFETELDDVLSSCRVMLDDIEYIRKEIIKDIEDERAILDELKEKAAR